MSDLRTAALRLLEAYDAHDPLTFYMEDLRIALNTKVDSEPIAKLPPEAQTEAEKVAYCAGWWDALEKKRSTASSTCEPLPPASPSQT